MRVNGIDISLEDSIAATIADSVADSMKDSVADSAKASVSDSMRNSVADSAKASVSDSVTLARFLELEGYQADRVAVQKNGKIISRFSYEQELLSDNDCLEIVSFVGGG